MLNNMHSLVFIFVIVTRVRCKGHCCAAWLKACDIPPFLLQDGASALHLAACYGHAAVVQLLLQKQADPNVRTYHRHLLSSCIITTSPSYQYETFALRVLTYICDQLKRYRAAMRG